MAHAVSRGDWKAYSCASNPNNPNGDQNAACNRWNAGDLSDSDAQDPPHQCQNLDVDPISHGWYFDDPVFLKDLTYTLAGDMDRNVIPTRVMKPSLSLTEK